MSGAAQPLDTAEVGSASPRVTHFKITSITNGTLYQHDGTTAIANNAFITKAEGCRHRDRFGRGRRAHVMAFDGVTGRS